MASVIVLFFIPLTIIVIVAFLVAGFRMYQEEGGEDVIKNVYVYLVLFATLMMVIGGSVSAFMSIADIVAPAPYHQTFEDYKRWEGTPSKNENGEEIAPLSEEELRENYNAMVTSYKEMQVERAKNTLIKSLGWIVIPLPIFLFFQRLVPKKEKA